MNFISKSANPVNFWQRAWSIMTDGQVAAEVLVSPDPDTSFSNRDPYAKAFIGLTGDYDPDANVFYLGEKKKFGERAVNTLTNLVFAAFHPFVNVAKRAYEGYSASRWGKDIEKANSVLVALGMRIPERFDGVSNNNLSEDEICEALMKYPLADLRQRQTELEACMPSLQYATLFDGFMDYEKLDPIARICAGPVAIMPSRFGIGAANLVARSHLSELPTMSNTRSTPLEEYTRSFYEARRVLSIVKKVIIRKTAEESKGLLCGSSVGEA